LIYGEGHKPGGNQSALTEWKIEVRVSDDVKEEFAIATAMNELGRGQSA
jgi:hypothetical protein